MLNISRFVRQTKLNVMKKARSNCPLTSALDIIGDKWSLIIIRDIFLGKKTFTEFMKSSEKIATNILANRLELLTSNGLIKVTKLPNDRKTKLYYLTDQGIDMYPIIYEMMQWSDRNLNKKFGPVGTELLKSSDGQPPKKVISKMTLSYLSKRDEILAKVQ
tara:strand:+ start:176 stop:658 length:483 start_codon:yes stop_codon:yes gene_type:complete